jgi:hypothetical protein
LTDHDGELARRMIAEPLPTSIRRLNDAQARVDELRREHDVQPGESLWEAMFGEPFPLNET